MKVKIGNTIFDSNYEPIMLIFEKDEERINVGKQIFEMVQSDTIRKYVQFPDSMNVDEIIKFMKK